MFTFNDLVGLDADLLKQLVRTNKQGLSAAALAAMHKQNDVRTAAANAQPQQPMTPVRDQVEQQSNQLKTMQQRGQAGLGSLTQQASLQPAPAQAGTPQPAAQPEAGLGAQSLNFAKGGIASFSEGGGTTPYAPYGTDLDEWRKNLEIPTKREDRDYVKEAGQTLGDIREAVSGKITDLLEYLNTRQAPRKGNAKTGVLFPDEVPPQPAATQAPAPAAKPAVQQPAPTAQAQQPAPTVPAVKAPVKSGIAALPAAAVNDYEKDYRTLMDSKEAPFDQMAELAKRKALQKAAGLDDAREAGNKLSEARIAEMQQQGQPSRDEKIAAMLRAMGTVTGQKGAGPAMGLAAAAGMDYDAQQKAIQQNIAAKKYELHLAQQAKNEAYAAGDATAITAAEAEAKKAAAELKKAQLQTAGHNAGIVQQGRNALAERALANKGAVDVANVNAARSGSGADAKLQETLRKMIADTQKQLKDGEYSMSPAEKKALKESIALATRKLQELTGLTEDGTIPGTPGPIAKVVGVRN